MTDASTRRLSLINKINFPNFFIILNQYLHYFYFLYLYFCKLDDMLEKKNQETSSNKIIQKVSYLLT